MVTAWQATLLGLIQGLTEFIPVSSTAHLRILPAFLNWGDPGAAYSAVIQLGTLFALVIYFWKDLLQFGGAALRGLFSGKPFADDAARMAWYLVLGTVPVSVCGLLFARFITGPFRSLYVIAASLIVLALALWITEFYARRTRIVHDITWKDALFIGLAQALALIPGASRAGVTLTMGLMLGFTREAAMRFSFLLSVPAIALSGLYELYQEWDHLASAGFSGLGIGLFVSALTGYITIAGLLRFLRTHTTLVFILYRIALGAFILLLLVLGILEPLG
ncbi:MAG: undecaprenyl-diphosphatase UppP [Spirochaetales bacterium]|nr:undecaprenyl-diphosphatase UppP [Spirochaetales bacterium]